MQNDTNVVNVVLLRPFRQRRWQFVLAGILTILFIAGGLRFFLRWEDHIRHVRLVNPLTLACVAALQVANVYLRSLYLGFITARLGDRIEAGESFCLTAATNLLGLWTVPALAVAYRGAYLHWKRYLKASHFACATAVFAVTWVFVSAATGSCGVTWTILTQSSNSHSIILLSSCLAVIAAMALVVLGMKNAPPLGRPFCWLGQLVARLHAVFVSREIVVVTCIVVVCLTATNVVGIRLTFTSFELPLGVREAVIMGSSQQLGALIAFTPGGFGFQEGTSLLFLGIVQSDLSRVFVALAVLRGVRLV